MTEEYVFPHNNWYLKFTEEQRSIVDNWRINIIKFSDKPCPTNYINWDGCGRTAGWASVSGSSLITFAQFEQYVLNISKESITKEVEDYSYLIPILQKINNEFRTN